MNPKKNFLKIIPYLLWLYLCSMHSPCFAYTIRITGQKIIDKPTLYKNVILDLSQGSFLITNNATLDLENSIIKGTISPLNPSLIKLATGKLVLRNNLFNIKVNDIPPDASLPSSYSGMEVSQGWVYMVGNSFTIDKPYTVRLFSTGNAVTTGLVISNNKIHNFHGGIFLTNSNHALITGNNFSNVSLSNIFTKNGSYSRFEKNKILYSGNNGLDIIDSNNIIIRDNYISLSSCYSIFILRSKNVFIDHNKITAGITYAIYTAPSIGPSGIYDKHLLALVDQNDQNSDAYKNKNIIVINNYFAQNRYGLSTINVDGLKVQNNTFIQRFLNDRSRAFWTNNDILLQNTIHINWQHNFYKEAYGQTTPPNNDLAAKWVIFPLHGGVVL